MVTSDRPSSLSRCLELLCDKPHISASALLKCLVAYLFTSCENFYREPFRSNETSASLYDGDEDERRLNLAGEKAAEWWRSVAENVRGVVVARFNT